ncbi:GRP family sugar transporter, partial [Staphylococcus epidermidis]|uniref:GRP family sugar transporter n=1 Tax=Staphylococcus epidermidis TaxID=1282 RepID=UPI001C92EF02
IGGGMSVWSERKEEEYSKNVRSGVVLLVVGEIGYWVYCGGGEGRDIGGFKGFLGEGIGMVIVGVIYALMNMCKGNAF